MNALESQLHYPLGNTLPEPGHKLAVAPGLYWLRMGLPFALDHINLWLLRDTVDGRDGWTIIDTGIDSAPTREAWQRVFDHELEGLPVVRVIATHYHPDHLGLAHWLCEHWQVRLWMSLGDFSFGRMLTAPGQTTLGGGKAGVAYYKSHGLTEGLDEIERRAGHYQRLVPAVPMQFRRMRDGDVVRIGARDWRVITGFGHAPEHVSLACDADGLLISGDMVLPRISTNVSVFELEPESSPVALYLESLGKYAGLAETTLVLPSHGKPFTGLHTRIAQLRDHHAERLAETLDACRAKPCSARDIVTVMFRRELDTHQMTFAMGEALAHLHYLWLEGRATRQIDAEGVIRFSAPAAA